MKKAFTMLELVMVMVIMGIVASIGADIIASMYMNYIRSRTINTLESKTEIVLEQIAKRLQYRIKESVIARKESDGTLMALSSYNNENDFNILEWIGYSNESFLGTPRPGWSGFIDLESLENNKTGGILKTSESNLTYAANIILALTDDNLTLNSASTAAGLIFKGKAYNIGEFGWAPSTNTNGTAVVQVSVNTETTFKVEENPRPDEIYEQYYLAHTAYAIVPEGNIAGTDFNITLYYNYQPWISSKNFYTNGSNSVLAEHVSLFRFKQDESILRLKLCLHDADLTGIGDRIVVCKEKVVY
jgi:prepilin-type N-terminal cleavage/methylation domain-containing protein